MAEGKDWKTNNKWKYYCNTPDETVVLDCDMLLLEIFPLVGFIMH